MDFEQCAYYVDGKSEVRKIYVIITLITSLHGNEMKMYLRFRNFEQNKKNIENIC